MGGCLEQANKIDRGKGLLQHFAKNLWFPQGRCVFFDGSYLISHISKGCAYKALLWKKSLLRYEEAWIQSGHRAPETAVGHGKVGTAMMKANMVSNWWLACSS